LPYNHLGAQPKPGILLIFILYIFEVNFTRCDLRAVLVAGWIVSSSEIYGILWASPASPEGSGAIMGTSIR